MGRAGNPVRLDIVGIEPRLFQICKNNIQSLIQARSKERLVSSDTSSDFEPANPELASIPKDQLAIYSKIVSITMDFEKAYGHCVVRVFKKSKSPFLNNFLRMQSLKGEVNPTFYVNGVRVYTGVPKTFSELDEAIDNCFGRGKERTP